MLITYNVNVVLSVVFIFVIITSVSHNCSTMSVHVVMDSAELMKCHTVSAMCALIDERTVVMSPEPHETARFMPQK